MFRVHRVDSYSKGTCPEVNITRRVLLKEPREHALGPGVHTNTAFLCPCPPCPLPVLTSPEVVVSQVLFTDLKSPRWFMVVWPVSQGDCRDDSALGASEHVFLTLSGSLNGM